MKILLIVFLFLDSSSGSKAFTIVAKGRLKDMEFIKAKSHYKATIDTSYCKGFFIPVVLNEWKCSQKGEQVVCRQKYECQKASAKRNRRTLSVDAKKYLRKKTTPKHTYEIKIVGKSHKKKDTTPLENIPEEEIDPDLALDPARDVLDGEGKVSAKWVAKAEVTPDGVPVYRKVRKKTKKRTLPMAAHGRINSFSFALMSLISDNDRLSTLDGSWTPYYQFGDRFALKGGVGGHFVRTKNVLRDVTFWVLSLDVHLVYFFKNRIFLEGGGGRQLWVNDGVDSYDIYTLGIGYKFRDWQLGFLDKIFTSIGLVSNRQDNIEIKLGAGFAF